MTGLHIVGLGITFSSDFSQKLLIIAKYNLLLLTTDNSIFLEQQVHIHIHFQTMDSAFHVLEKLALTTEPSGISRLDLRLVSQRVVSLNPTQYQTLKNQINPKTDIPR